MHDLMPVFLALLVSRRELRFDPVAEQSGPLDCGYAVARALVELDAPRDASRGLTLGAFASLLERGGLPARALRLSLPEIDEVLDRGFSPIVINYEHPSRHWALLLGKRSGSRGPGLYGLSDPARGLEVLDGGELAGRFGGVAIVIDTASLGRGKQLEAVQAGERAFARWDGLARLAGGAAAAAPVAISAPRAAVPRAAVPRVAWPKDAALDLSPSLAFESGISGLAADARFSVSLRSGLTSMGLELPVVFSPGVGGRESPLVELPRILFAAAIAPLPWVATLAFTIAPPATAARVWADAGAGTRGGQTGSDSGSSVRIGLARIMDPLLLEIVGTVMDSCVLTPGPWGCSVAIKATEAVSERFFLALGSELGWQAAGPGRGLAAGGSWSESVSIVFSMRLDGWSLGFGFSDRDDGGRVLRFSGDYELRLE